jgi:hypothetical protein
MRQRASVTRLLPQADGRSDDGLSCRSMGAVARHHWRCAGALVTAFSTLPIVLVLLTCSACLLIQSLPWRVRAAMNSIFSEHVSPNLLAQHAHMLFKKLQFCFGTYTVRGHASWRSLQSDTTTRSPSACEGTGARRVGRHLVGCWPQANSSTWNQPTAWGQVRSTVVKQHQVPRWPQAHSSEGHQREHQLTALGNVQDDAARQAGIAHHGYEGVYLRQTAAPFCAGCMSQVLTRHNVHPRQGQRGPQKKQAGVRRVGTHKAHGGTWFAPWARPAGGAQQQAGSRHDATRLAWQIHKGHGLALHNCAAPCDPHMELHNRAVQALPSCQQVRLASTGRPLTAASWGAGEVHGRDATLMSYARQLYIASAINRTYFQPQHTCMYNKGGMRGLLARSRKLGGTAKAFCVARLRQQMRGCSAIGPICVGYKTLSWV